MLVITLKFEYKAHYHLRKYAGINVLCRDFCKLQVSLVEDKTPLSHDVNSDSHIVAVILLFYFFINESIFLQVLITVLKKVLFWKFTIVRLGKIHQLPWFLSRPKVFFFLETGIEFLWYTFNFKIILLNCIVTNEGFWTDFSRTQGLVRQLIIRDIFET